MTTSVLVPYRPDGAWRDRAWAALEPRWREFGYELIVESPGPGRHSGEFNHPRAINTARRRASGEVLIVADADTGWDPPGWVENAVAEVRNGYAPWALPAEYWKLTAAATARALNTGLYPGFDEAEDDDEAEVNYGGSWSGVVIVAAEAFDLVGGYDERWEFWGSDDAAFAITMTTLVGAPSRLPGRCLHHWHPAPLAETYGHERHQRQHALQERYAAAAGDPAAIRDVRFGVRGESHGVLG